METWHIISEYYWIFALCFLVVMGIGWLMSWSMIGFKEAFKGAIYTLEIPLIGFIIDENNSWIYLSLCIPIVLEIIGKLQGIRIGSTDKLKVKN